MGFFKDFKDDLSQAVNELLPDEELYKEDKEAEDNIVNTLDSEEIIPDDVPDNEKMMEWLNEFTQEKNEEDSLVEENHEEDSQDIESQNLDNLDVDNLEENNLDDENLDDENLDEENLDEDNLEENDQEEDNQEDYDQEEDNLEEDNLDEEPEDIEDYTEEIRKEEGAEMDDNVDLELLEALNAEENAEQEEENTEKPVQKSRVASAVSDDEVTVISKGTTITGSISSDGSLDIMGTITGDIECLGKLSITGKVNGNSSAAEVYINTERMLGNITSEGSVKVGLGTVVIGDINATSGVIAGAVKGEIDVNGPIVIDSTAIIKGNIKAKSVQINNGAVIEGFCSLSYSAVDVDNIFE